MITPGLIRATPGLLESGTVMALAARWRCAVYRLPDQRDLGSPALGQRHVLFSRNIGLSLVVILLYTLTSLSNRRWYEFPRVVGLLRPNNPVSAADLRALAEFVLVPISIVCSGISMRVRWLCWAFPLSLRQSVGNAADP